MKRFFYALGAVAASLALFAGCAKNSDLENLSARVDKIETEKIESIESLIASINTVITSLQDYIDVLENENVDLQNEVTVLRTYVDSLIDDTQRWVKNTYVTMSMYSSLSQDYKDLYNFFLGLETKLETTDGTVADHTKLIEGLQNELKQEIDDLSQMISELRIDVIQIQTRIQSLTYIPRYSDCAAAMTYSENGTAITPGSAELDFRIEPAEYASELASQWADKVLVIKMIAVYTITKAQTEEIELTISSVTAPEEGRLRVVVSGNGLRDAFFNGTVSANVCLRIGYSDAVAYSDYVLLSPWKLTALTFPDTAFTSFCKENLDSDGDGSFTDYDAAAVTEMDCSSATEIVSFDGLKYFSSLRKLDVSGTGVTSLDVTANPFLDTLRMEDAASLTSLTCQKGLKIKTNFAVGRQLKVNGSSGVVFSVSTDGFTTKLISLDKKTKITWADAKTWCESKGTLWGLPSLSDLNLIKTNQDTISSALTTAGGSSFMTNSSYDIYWSYNTFQQVRDGVSYTMVNCTEFKPEALGCSYQINMPAKYAPSARAACIL